MLEIVYQTLTPVNYTSLALHTFSLNLKLRYDFSFTRQQSECIRI